ncbi:hypothetical protein [Actinomycetospora cinnamomea]|uniref:Uncharacterized protein n=1 Tax=Actinomycetospora cinnamomea TaxID=663609 RepID=A0A2U1EAA0_9PSEU|nr:hypothetical protein [Actinomycetospora cinnamomea]PVY96878.1 hypothetical protein C8D89_1275 [Actinomycetospora cinnamomea]
MTVPAPGPPRPGPPRPAGDGEALAGLRAAVAALPEAAAAPAEEFDAADHAARFEAVHDALVAVLADVDGT